MDVFLMIRRKKSTIFVDAQESTTVLELKKMIQGIMKIAPEDICLFKVELSERHKMPSFMEDNNTLAVSGITSSTAQAHAPATIGMAFRARCEVHGGHDFEELSICTMSSPPELPEAMKPEESGSPQDTEQDIE